MSQLYSIASRCVFAVTLATACSTAPDAPLPPETAGNYTLTELGVPAPSVRVTLVASNADGSVIIGASQQGTTFQPVVWRNGNVAFLPTPDAGQYEAKAINASGTIVGARYYNSGNCVEGVMWKGSTVSVIRDPSQSAACQMVVPKAIDDAGRVAGYAGLGFVLDAGTFTKIGVDAERINHMGTLAGYNSIAEKKSVIVWKSGVLVTGQAAPSLAPLFTAVPTATRAALMMPPFTTERLLGLSDADEALVETDVIGALAAPVWNLRRIDGTSRPVDPALVGRPGGARLVAMNSAGTILAMQDPAPHADAVLETGGVITPVVIATPGYHMSDVVALSDGNVILGYAYRPTPGDPVPAVLTPKP